ncbi:hypothetical protein BGW39_009212 [Mortierella sp. 14UC]|nr:hypothetical protein BGW39_009212 [Mortierella sp. 14UC]
MDMDLDDEDAFDSIFQSIMNSHEEELGEKEEPRHRSSPLRQSPEDSFIVTKALTTTDNNTNRTQFQQQQHLPLPNHLPHKHVPGLCLHTNVLSDKDQARLMAQITEKNFFKAGQQNQAMCFGQCDLAWLNWLICERLLLHPQETEAGVLKEPYCSSSWTTRIPLFDQSIMNLYFPGNGIKPHVDLARFEDGIVIISLLSAINMDFYKAQTPMSPNDPPEGRSSSPKQEQSKEQGGQRVPDFTVRLEPGSVLTIQGKARYEWEHGIQETMEDLVEGGETVRRKIRVSITLRKMRSAAWEVGGGGEERDSKSAGPVGETGNGVADR